MNKRIQQLAMQTDIWCDQNVAQGSPMYNNQWEQKFAELIVRETLQIARVGMEFGPSIDEAVYTYFGIEE